MSTMPKVSVVTTTYNDMDNLCRIMEAGLCEYRVCHRGRRFHGRNRGDADPIIRGTAGSFPLDFGAGRWHL